MKLSNEQRAEMLKQIYSGELTIRQASAKYQVTEENIKYHLSQSKKKDIDANRHIHGKVYEYSRDFKERAVSYVRETGCSYRKAGEVFGVSYQNVRSWCILSEGNPSPEAGEKMPEKKDESGYGNLSRKELEERLRRAECEVAFLKKVNALVQERVRREGRKSQGQS